MPYKRFLIIAYAFPPNGSVGACIRIVKFLKYLNQLEKDWQFEVLTANLNSSHFSKAASSIASDVPTRVIIHRAKVILEPNDSIVRNLSGEALLSAKNKAKALFKRIVRISAKALYNFLKHWIFLPDDRIRWFLSAITMGKKLIDEKKFDLILATTPPYTVGLVGQRLARYGKIPLVLDIRDDWTTHPEYFKKSLIAKKTIQISEKKCINRAKKVLLVTPASYKTYLSLYPEYERKFALITNGCDLEEFKISGSIKSNSVFRIIHSGPFSGLKRPDAILEAFYYLKKEGKCSVGSIKMCFIGGLRDVESRKMVGAFCIGEIIEEIPFLNRRTYIEVLRRANLAIVINARGASTLIPGKIYEYWASKTPIILIDYSPSAASELIRQYNLGVVCQPDDIQAIANAICDFARRHFKGESIQPDRNGLDRFDRKNLSTQLHELFTNIMM